MTPAPRLGQKPRGQIVLEHLVMSSSVPMQPTLVRPICVELPISLSVITTLLSAEDIMYNLMTPIELVYKNPLLSTSYPSW
jgi:hypothetical protein